MSTENYVSLEKIYIYFLWHILEMEAQFDLYICRPSYKNP